MERWYHLFACQRILRPTSHVHLTPHLPLQIQRLNTSEKQILNNDQVGPIPGPPNEKVQIHETTIGPHVHDFYRTDAVSRASVTMAKTSALHRETASTWEY